MRDFLAVRGNPACGTVKIVLPKKAGVDAQNTVLHCTRTVDREEFEI